MESPSLEPLSSTVPEENENVAELESELAEPLSHLTNEKENEAPSERNRFVKLPFARVKSLMKMDPDCKIISHDAVFLATKAAEKFLQMLGLALYEQVQNAKRKTINTRDLDKVIKESSNLCFMDGTMDSLS